jgi:hypothetical protein
VAVLPGDLEKPFSVEVGSLSAKEGFKSPLNIGALPWTKTVAAGSEPVELEDVPHEGSPTQIFSLEQKTIPRKLKEDIDTHDRLPVFQLMDYRFSSKNW